MTTILLIAVIHTIEHVIAAPSFRDAVSMVFAQKLIFSALLDTVHLVWEQQRKPKILSRGRLRCTGEVKNISVSMESNMSPIYKMFKKLNVSNSVHFISQLIKNNMTSCYCLCDVHIIKYDLLNTQIISCTSDLCMSSVLHLLITVSD